MKGAPILCGGCYLLRLFFYLNACKKQNSWYLEMLPELPIAVPVLAVARCSSASRAAAVREGTGPVT